MTNIQSIKKRADSHELQTNTLAAFQREKSLLTIYLMNHATPIVGRIKRFDMYTVTVSSDDGKYHLLFKHGIAGFSVDAEIFRNMKFEEVKPEPGPAVEQKSA